MQLQLFLKLHSPSFTLAALFLFFCCNATHGCVGSNASDRCGRFGNDDDDEGNN